MRLINTASVAILTHAPTLGARQRRQVVLVKVSDCPITHGAKEPWRLTALAAKFAFRLFPSNPVWWVGTSFCVS